MKNQKRWFGLLLVVVASLVAGYVTFFKQSRGGLELMAERSSGASVSDVAVPEDMKALTDLYRTINLVQKRYIDAARIDSREMFIGALKAIELSVARVMIEETDESLTLKIASREKAFDLADIKTPWVLLQRIKEVFTFIKEEASKDALKLSDIEYAAINGMLKTLDPHSVFLNPDQYREMKDKTHGNFAGLGIVISIRDGMLTVISPIDGTPADRAGLRAGDQIIKIDDESTVNMSLNDAVDLLRGAPGTNVMVHVLRKGWAEAKSYNIVRAIVKVESLETQLLSGRVGYLRIKDFQGNTAEDIQEVLTSWAAKRIQGLVLDLRGCPGGLLEAAVEVSDLFLKSGVIVTTAGQGPGDRDTRHAVDSGDEPSYPLVVIVDQGSASASEIVAGALKNHRRAVVIGEQTFGKGSVQVLFEFQDSHLPNRTTALKLTTAQYLTPGDISIQSVGVTPHLNVLPMRADDEMVDLKVEKGYREADLSHHFVVDRLSSAADSPLATIHYLWTPPPSDETDAETPDDSPPPLPDDDRPFEPDFVINLARDMVATLAPIRPRSDEPVFEALSGLLKEKRREEEKRLVTALKRLDIDWQSPQGEVAPAVAEVSLDINDTERVEAGRDAVLSVTVTNKGPGTFFRLAATSRSDFRPFDDREVAFGRVGPNETVTRTLTFPVPKDALAEVNDVLWTFDAEGPSSPRPAAIRFSVSPVPRPHFAYKHWIDDTEKGNGDGRVQVGESVSLMVEVENRGDGRSLNTYATLKSLSDKFLFLIRGRESLEELAPNSRKTASFSFEVRPEFVGSAARFEMAVADVDLREYLVEKIEIPVFPKDHAVAAGAAQAQKKGAFNAAPTLLLEPVPHVTQKTQVLLRGVAEDPDQVRDVFIFVDNDKKFFESAGRPDGTKRLEFEASLPLSHGINYITVVAEESPELQTRKTIAIRRDRQDNMPFLLSRNSTDKMIPLGVVPDNRALFGETLRIETAAPISKLVDAQGTAPILQAETPR